MNTKIAATGITVAAALALSLAGAPSPAAAVPTGPTPQAVKLKQTKHADVDGDGRRDTVRIYHVGTKDSHAIWKVKVTTARGKTSSVTYTSPGFAPDAPWYGWAKLDGTRGAELLLHGYTDDFFTVTVLTWRAGRLRIERAPADPSTTAHEKHWSAAAEVLRSGYRLYTKSGRRYVNVWDADCPDSQTGTCTVKTKRSVWKKGAWRTVKTLPVTQVAAATIYARTPFGALAIHP